MTYSKLLLLAILSLFLWACKKEQTIPEDLHIGKWRDEGLVPSEGFDKYILLSEADTFAEVGEYWIGEHNYGSKISGSFIKNDDTLILYRERLYRKDLPDFDWTLDEDSGLAPDTVVVVIVNNQPLNLKLRWFNSDGFFNDKLYVRAAE